MTILRGRSSSRYSNTLFGYKRDPLSIGRIILPAAMLVLGIGLSVGAFSEYRRASALAAHGLRAPAKVVDVRVSESRDAKNRVKKSYLSTGSFVDKNGVAHTFTESRSRTIGEGFEIIYDPSDPSRVNSVSSLWTGALIFGGFAVVLSVAGLFFLPKAITERFRAQAIVSAGHFVPAIVTEVRSRVVSHRKKSRNSIGHTTYSNRRTRYEFQVIAESADGATGQRRSYVSYALSTDPGEQIVGKRIQILVDPADPDSYYFGERSLWELR